MALPKYDVLIVGAGIAGCALAHALSTLPRSKPLRIALLERSLSEPDRIVGELLQPGGVLALRKLGIESCVDGIDAIPVHGYCVFESGKSVQIPYPGTHEGRSFHHGRFVMKLREAASKAKGVDVIEASVTEFIERERRVIGVRATRKKNVGGEASNGPDTAEDTVKEQFFADLVVVADGCFSNFRAAVMGSAMAKSTTKSHFIGAVLEDAKLPIPKHGTVALIKGFGPVLLYQIGEHDTRMLVDVKAPLPSDLKTHILTNVVPQLPAALHLPVQIALSKDRLRRMPNSFLPAVSQGPSSSISPTGSKAGVFLIGDAWNMRHPLTGAGMTVALNDVVMLRTLLEELPEEGGFGDWEKVREVLGKWHWRRKPLASTINILSIALYDLFGADGEELEVLRTGCFKYFELGGECIQGPVSLLSGIAQSPLLLAAHFFAVAFYAIWVMFTHPHPIPSSSGKPTYATPTIDQYPSLLLKSMRVFYTACIVFGPLLWSEIRWWSPSDTARRNKALAGVAGVVIPVLVTVGCALAYAGGWRVGVEL